MGELFFSSAHLGDRSPSVGGISVRWMQERRAAPSPNVGGQVFSVPNLFLSPANLLFSQPSAPGRAARDAAVITGNCFPGRRGFTCLNESWFEGLEGGGRLGREVAFQPRN